MAKARWQALIVYETPDKKIPVRKEYHSLAELAEDIEKNWVFETVLCLTLVRIATLAEIEQEHNEVPA